MGNSIIYSVIRIAAVYALASLLSRLIGRKLISQMTFFDFIVGVSMGSLAANVMIIPGRLSENPKRVQLLRTYFHFLRKK